MNEVYFVYWDEGSCNDGSHTNGLEQFQTLDEAYKRIVELTTKNKGNYTEVWDSSNVTLIKGVIIDHNDNPHLQTIHRTASPDPRESKIRQIPKANS